MMLQLGNMASILQHHACTCCCIMRRSMPAGTYVSSVPKRTGHNFNAVVKHSRVLQKLAHVFMVPQQLTAQLVCCLVHFHDGNKPSCCS